MGRRLSPLLAIVFANLSVGVRWVSVLATPLLVLACATEPGMDPSRVKEPVPERSHEEKVSYIRGMLGEQAKVTRVAYRVTTAASELCKGETIATTGAYFMDWTATNPANVDAWKEATGIDLRIPGIEVLIVPVGAPADLAGLRPGDRILTVDEWEVPTDQSAYPAFMRHLNQRMASSASTITFGVNRGGKTELHPITLEQRCRYPVLLVDGAERNAFTDGQSIFVLRGMTEFTRNDLDLAVVISHELSHILRDHVPAAMENARKGAAAGMLVGTVFDVLIAATTGVYVNIGQNVGGNVGATAGALVYSKEHESEADYYSAYVVALAGYDYKDIPGFVRYVAGKEEWKSGYNLSHPSFAEREASLIRTVSEIDRKKEAGIPLQPDQEKLK